MDEDTFRDFYDRTVRALWAYLARVTGEPQLADDLLQETYYRFLRCRALFDGDTHRRQYLFRIATNLVHDTRRRRGVAGLAPMSLAEVALPAGEPDLSERIGRRTDLTRAMARLKPRERALLWLAYAQGSSHREIAGVLGLRVTSIKPLLFRARQKLARLLRAAGPHREGGA
jgi:RNA polymerase sigma-70 factor (ECF subfamily)